MGNLKLALQMRFADRTPDRTLIQPVAALIDQAAVGIERLYSAPMHESERR